MLGTHCSCTGVTSLRHAATPFCAEGTLHDVDDEELGELGSVACKILMKYLWLGRLARPDLIKPIGDLTTHIQSWTRNCDKMLYKLTCYIKSTADHQLVSRVGDKAQQLGLRLYTDADFAGEKSTARSTNGGLLALVGPDSFFPLAWISKRQTATSRSTTEAEMISLAYGLFAEALPALSLWERILGRPMTLKCMQDNQATIIVAKRGYSPKLRHVARTHRVDLSSVAEVLEQDGCSIEYIQTHLQAADIFTKALGPQKWGPALKMIGLIQLPPKATHKA